MFYVEEIKLHDAAGLLSACGLTEPQGVDYTAGVFSMEAGFGSSGFSVGGFGSGGFGGSRDRLVACGSLKDDMIQGVAVDPAFQGEDLTGKLMTHLIGVGRERGWKTLYLFTKAEKAQQFVGLGFRLVAKARPYAALLEWGEAGVKEYMEKLAAVREEVAVGEDNGGGADGSDRAGAEASGGVGTQSGGMAGHQDATCCESPLTASGSGALVMNCNPFTKGHRYLIEYAAARKAHVFILAVEEDKSLFTFADRLEMLRRGTADLANVTVIPGGRYAVSTLTFPSYFTGEENLAAAHAAIDGELFAACIAPALGADERFLGTEPLSAVTAVYNETLKNRLPKKGIAVTEVPRLEIDGQVISATAVREILQKEWEAGGLLAGLAEETLAKLRALLPESTITYLQQSDMLARLDKAFALREKEQNHG